MRIFERTWGWASWQNLNEDREGNVKGLPYHGRAWLHFNKAAVASCCFTWHLWSKVCGISFSASPDCENSLAWSIAFPPFAFWFTIDARGWLARFATWLVSLQPSDMGTKWSGRDLSLSVFDYAIWWKLWVCDYGWTRTRPKWRDGSWHPLGFNRTQGEPELIEERKANVMMPECDYRANVRLERVKHGWDKLPRCFDKTITHAKVDMLEGEEIPFPGKGTCSYNCGEDACFGWSGPAESIDDATWQVSLSVLKDRKRYPL